MSRYEHFNDCMSSVLDRADSLCCSHRGRSLQDRCQSPAFVFAFLTHLLSAPWEVVSSVFDLMEKPPMVFAGIMASFPFTPLSLLLMSTLGMNVLELKRSLMGLYHARTLTLALKKIGEKYLPMWNSCTDNRDGIDPLCDHAARELLYFLGV